MNLLNASWPQPALQGYGRSRSVAVPICLPKKGSALIFPTPETLIYYTISGSWPTHQRPCCRRQMYKNVNTIHRTTKDYKMSPANQPLVSIVTLTWNTTDITCDFLRSINEHGTYKNLEVIIVD